MKELEVQSVVLLLQIVEVVPKRNRGIVVNGDKAIIRVLLAVFIDEATTQHCHLGTVEGRHLWESTRLDLIAAIFGEEDGDRRGLKHCCNIVVSRGCEGVDRTAPRVGVQTEKVRARRVAISISIDGALEVIPGVFQNGTNVCGGVAHRYRSIRVLRNVLLQVTLDSLPYRLAYEALDNPLTKGRFKLTLMYGGLS